MSFILICEINAIWSSCWTYLNEDLVLIPSWRFFKIFSIRWFLEYLRFLELEGSSNCVASAVDPWRCCSFSWFSSSGLVFEGSLSESLSRVLSTIDSLKSTWENSSTQLFLTWKTLYDLELSEYLKK